MARDIDRHRHHHVSQMNTTGELGSLGLFVDTLRPCRPWNFTAPLEEMLANQRAMTDSYIPQLKTLAPDSGCYLNEVRENALPSLWWT